MKTEIQIELGYINLGIRQNSNDPSNDKQQWLQIDEFEVNTSDRGLYISPIKWHIIEYDVHYCYDCAKLGKERVIASTRSSTSENNRCKDHQKERDRLDHPCPRENCDGYVIFGCCSERRCSNYYDKKCDYYIPDVLPLRGRIATVAGDETISSFGVGGAIIGDRDFYPVCGCTVPHDSNIACTTEEAKR